MIVLDNKTYSLKFICDFYKTLFIFDGVNSKIIEAISKTTPFEIVEYENEEIIYSPSVFANKVGFVLEGECLIEKIKTDGTTIPLNKLSKSDSFGILAVFSKNKLYPTLVKAVKKSRILFFDKKTIYNLIKDYHEISIAIMSFMSNRIDFLNKKIATFSADSVEEKFVYYILSEAKSTDSLTISLNLSKTAKILNAGRASIYRAIESLENLSLIKLENKKIYILDLKGLERISL